MIRVGIFLADGFEEIEGLTQVDVLRRAGFEVTTISIMQRKQIEGAHQIKVEADRLYEETEFDGFDALILPGGQPGTNNLLVHQGLKEVLQRFAEAGKLLAAICAAPTVLAAAGLLDGKRATCYPGCEGAFSDKVIFTGAKVEEDGMIITANGMAQALAFSFAIVGKLAGNEAVEAVKKGVAFSN